MRGKENNKMVRRIIKRRKTRKNRQDRKRKEDTRERKEKNERRRERKHDKRRKGDHSGGKEGAAGWDSELHSAQVGTQGDSAVG